MKNRTERWIAGSCLLLSVLSMGFVLSSPLAMSLVRGERISGLLIGSDYSDYARHSDTLMFVSYDAGSRFLDVLSIPRDTMVSIPDRPSIRRVNEVFTYEFRHSGRDFTMASLALTAVVETMLSSGSAAAVKIPYFFTIDYSGFKAFIEAIGGVTVKVTEPMHYDDHWGKLHIHFDPGVYHVNGQKALEYVRFRGGSADQGRQRRQQLFLKQVVGRLKNPTVLWGLPRHAALVFRGFHSNLSATDALALLMEARRLNVSNMRLISVPGEPQGMLWKMNVPKTQSIVGLMRAQAPVGAKREFHELQPVQGAVGGHPTVEVWNASNKPSAARRVVRQLRHAGFDVVRYGNFSTRQTQTLVLDRSGDLRPAQAVAGALIGAHADVVSRPDFSLQVDVSVIIGNDYQEKDPSWF